MKILLFPFSLIFDLLTRIRNCLYLKKILPVYYPENKTIVVGNLCMGGSGKTPVSEFLLSLFQNKQIEVTYLSRGYKRKTRGFKIAKDEKDHTAIGDEAYQIYSKFKDISVLISEKRKIAIQKFTAQSGFKGVFLLDDAFQHRSVRCGMYILLTSYHKPYFKDLIFPAGSLRESMSFASLADVIIITKCPEELNATEIIDFLAKLKPMPHQKVFFTSFQYLQPYHAFSKKTTDIHIFKDSHLVLFAGIADPHYLIVFLRKYCTSLKVFRYKDHHVFSKKNIQDIIQAFNQIDEENKIILTTEKDFFRLKNTDNEKLFENLPLYILPVKIKFLENRQVEFEKIILDYVGKDS